MSILLEILIVTIVFVVAFFVMGTFFCSEFLKITKTDLCYTTEYILGNGHLIKRITNTGLPVFALLQTGKKKYLKKANTLK